MSKMVRLVTIALAVALLSGCMTINQNQPSAPLNPILSTNALKADIAVGEKISAKSSMNILFGFIKFGGDNKFADGVSYSGAGDGGFAGLIDPTSAVKSAAAYNAVKGANADIIVHPSYVLEVNDYFIFKKVTATVTGYKGTIKSIQ